jgi:hypothetical protein
MAREGFGGHRIQGWVLSGVSRYITVADPTRSFWRTTRKQIKTPHICHQKASSVICIFLSSLIIDKQTKRNQNEAPLPPYRGPALEHGLQMCCSRLPKLSTRRMSSPVTLTLPAVALPYTFPKRPINPLSCHHIHPKPNMPLTHLTEMRVRKQSSS